MANAVLLNNLSYLEGLLSAMEEKLNRMTQLSNSIRNEELYYSYYKLEPNIFKMPQSLKFHPILKFCLWLLCTMGLVTLRNELMLAVVMLVPLNLYFMKRNRSILVTIFLLFFLGVPFGGGVLLGLLVAAMGDTYSGTLSGSGFLAACAAAYLVTYLFARWRVRQVNGELEAENNAAQQRNEQTRSRNQSLTKQCRSLNQEICSLQNQVADAVQQMNYPPDYVCLNAVHFFIHALRNDRADTFRQLIDLYEKNNYRVQMLQSQQELAGLMNQQIYNQERMSQLISYSNGLNAANLAAQIQTQAEIRSLQDTVRSASSLAYSQYN